MSVNFCCFHSHCSEHSMMIWFFFVKPIYLHSTKHIKLTVYCLVNQLHGLHATLWKFANFRLIVACKSIDKFPWNQCSKGFYSRKWAVKIANLWSKAQKNRRISTLSSNNLQYVIIQLFEHIEKSDPEWPLTHFWDYDLQLPLK